MYADYSLISGNFLVIASTTSVLLALAWGGVTYPWKSFRVLVPLILGIVGWAAFLLYEFLFAKEDAIVPFRLLKDRTSLSGYVLPQFPFVSMVIFGLQAFNNSPSWCHCHSCRL